jgi:hypothetical protein
MLDLANRDLVESHLSGGLARVHRGRSIRPSPSCSCSRRPGRRSAPTCVSADGPPRDRPEALRRMGRVLDLLAGRPHARDRAVVHGPVTPTPGSSHRGPDGASTRRSSLARALRAAEEQRDAARRSHGRLQPRPPREARRQAPPRPGHRPDQPAADTSAREQPSSDFYTYRYLATEGFLPGYNFPRLPLMAFVPSTSDGRAKQTYLQRPRFLALSEFGPRSLVYHEGRAFRVVRAMLSLGRRDGSGRSPDDPAADETIRICRPAARALRRASSMCHACGAPSAAPRSSTTSTASRTSPPSPAERITANDEERQRQGFELQTTFQWAKRDGVLDVRGAASPWMPDGEVARLTYGRARRSPASTRGCAAGPTRPSSASRSIRSRATGPSRRRRRRRGPPIRPSPTPQRIVPMRAGPQERAALQPRPRHSSASLGRPRSRRCSTRCCAASRPSSSSRGRGARRADAHARRAQRLPALRGDRGRRRRADPLVVRARGASPRSPAVALSGHALAVPTTARCRRRARRRQPNPLRRGLLPLPAVLLQPARSRPCSIDRATSGAASFLLRLARRRGPATPPPRAPGRSGPDAGPERPLGSWLDGAAPGLPPPDAEPLTSDRASTCPGLARALRRRGAGG